MLSLYEILKASKTGIAPDMWTALAGMNWGGADSGHEVKELTGIPPLSFTADGTPLLDYLISGNMFQSDTPTPTTPIQPQECGERTAQLFDKNTMVVNDYLNNIDGTYTGSFSNSYSCVVKVKPNTSYRVRVYSRTFRIGLFTNSPTNNAVPNSFVMNDKGTYSTYARIITTGASDNYIVLFCYNNSYEYLDGKTLDEIMSTVMISEGSEMAVLYEPYGYKIPISSGGVTTNIYLGSTQTVRQIKKLVLDGTENWAESPCTIGYRFVIPITSAMPSDTTIGVRSMCTHQILVGTGETYLALGAYTISNRSELIMTLNGDTRLASWKSWLATQYANGTPVTVWYVLATPETAALNEPLMKIGNYVDTLSMEQAGVQIPTNRGNTVIDVDTTLKPSQMYIKYQK